MFKDVYILLSYFVNSQNWLTQFIDDHHLDYVTNFKKQEKHCLDVAHSITFSLINISIKYNLEFNFDHPCVSCFSMLFITSFHMVYSVIRFILLWLFIFGLKFRPI
jgi:hypothetical protein